MNGCRMSEQDLIPNFTQLPNKLMDYIIPLLRESEEKVLLYVLRSTYGYRDQAGHQKEQDYISFSQFIGGKVCQNGQLLNFGCGVSRPKLTEALAFHQATGLIQRLDAAAGKLHPGRGGTGLYRLNRACEMVQYLNHCLQEPETAREKMVQYLNQKRLMVQKLNQKRREDKHSKDRVKNGSESEPLINGSESEPEMVKKVNLQNKEKETKLKDTPLPPTDEKSSGAEKLTPGSMLHRWNEICVPAGLPRKLRLNETLIHKTSRRLQEHPEPEFWLTVFHKLAKIPFYRGDNDRQWQADFDWIVKNDSNAERIYERNEKIQPAKREARFVE
jgi:hypothetical protein